MLKRKIIHAISSVLKNPHIIIWAKTTFELLDIFKIFSCSFVPILYNPGFPLWQLKGCQVAKRTAMAENYKTNFNSIVVHQWHRPSKYIYTQIYMQI